MNTTTSNPCLDSSQVTSINRVYQGFNDCLQTIDTLHDIIQIQDTLIRAQTSDIYTLYNAYLNQKEITNISHNLRLQTERDLRKEKNKGTVKSIIIGASFVLGFFLGTR